MFSVFNITNKTLEDFLTVFYTIIVMYDKIGRFCVLGKIHEDVKVVLRRWKLYKCTVLYS